MIQPALKLLRGRGILALVRLICVGLGLIVSSSMHIALAQDSSDSSKEAQYQELINYALEEYDRGNWEESASLFNRAHQLIPSARTLRGLGLTTYEARRYAESVRYLRAALTDKRRALTEKQREEVQATLDRAKLFVANLQIDLTPRDAQLTINGRAVEPESDGSYIVDSGFVDLEASASGYQTSTRRLRVGGGEQQKVSLRLASLAPVEPEHVAERSAPVLSEPAPVAPTLTPSTSSEASPLSTWKWVAGAGAVVALGVGGTMLAMQKVQAPAYERECNKSPTPASDCDARHTYLRQTLWTGSIVGLSIGGALAALTVTLFVLDANNKSDSQSAANHPRLMCGGGPLGVACSGQF